MLGLANLPQAKAYKRKKNGELVQRDLKSLMPSWKVALLTKVFPDTWHQMCQEWDHKFLAAIDIDLRRKAARECKTAIENRRIAALLRTAEPARVTAEELELPVRELQEAA